MYISFPLCECLDKEKEKTTSGGEKGRSVAHLQLWYVPNGGKRLKS